MKLFKATHSSTLELVSLFSFRLKLCVGGLGERGRLELSGALDREMDLDLDLERIRCPLTGGGGGLCPLANGLLSGDLEVEYSRLFPLLELPDGRYELP